MGSGNSQYDTVPSPHRKFRLLEILAGILALPKRHWYKVLGEVRYMAIYLTGARVLFSHTQEALRHIESKRDTLKKSVHKNPEYFHCIDTDIDTYPPRIYKLITLTPTVDGYNDASG